MSFAIFNKFSDRSCKDLLSERIQLDVELKKRKNQRVSEIDKEYKEKAREIRSKFNDVARMLGTAIPTTDYIDNATIDVQIQEAFSDFIQHCIHFHREYPHYPEMHLVGTSELMRNIIKAVSKDDQHNWILGFAMQVELEKLENERLAEISKIGCE